MKQEQQDHNCVVKEPSCHPVRGEERGSWETRLEAVTASFLFSPSSSRLHLFRNGSFSAQSAVPHELSL